MMPDIACRAIHVSFYKKLQRTYQEDWSIEIIDDHIRRITHYVGQMICEDDCARRDIALQHLKLPEMTPERQKSGNQHVPCIEMDGQCSTPAGRKQVRVGIQQQSPDYVQEQKRAKMSNESANASRSAMPEVPIQSCASCTLLLTGMALSAWQDCDDQRWCRMDQELHGYILEETECGPHAVQYFLLFFPILPQSELPLSP